MGYLVCDNCKAYYKIPKGEDPTEFSSICFCGNDLKYFESLDESSLKNFDNLICPNCGSENDKKSRFCLNCGSKLNQFETYAQELKKSIQSREKITKNESVNNNKFCPSCGNENLADAAFCKGCGKELVNMIGKCPYCKEEINPNAIKCKHCGEWLNKKIETGSKKENLSGTIVLGYIFSSLIGIIGIIFALYLITKPEKEAKKHGSIMLMIIILWVMCLLWIWGSSLTMWIYFHSGIVFYYGIFLAIGNFLIALIFVSFITNQNVKLSTVKLLTLSLLWLIIIILYFIMPPYIIFADIILIITIYLSLKD